MKRFLLITTLGLLSILSVSAQETLKIMSYNIQSGINAPIEEIGQYIASEEVDLVALQECDWINNRSKKSNPGKEDLINVLAHETRMFPLYGQTIHFAGGFYGIGLLSRYPIVRSECIELPNPSKDEQRVMLKADVKLPSGKIVTFICTHLDYKSDDVQLEQVKFINKHTKEKNLTFICGDFNCTPESAPSLKMRERWTDLTNRDFTFSTKYPEVKIDYIYAKKGHDVDLISTRVVYDTLLSDHFQIVSVVKIGE